MGPKRNKNKENAFYYYMCEKRSEVEKRVGRKVTMAELPSFVHKEWKELPEERKIRFKEMCSDYKGGCEKYDSRGLALSTIQKELEDKQTRMLSMREDIKKNINMLRSNESISSERFNVMCITYYLHLEDDSYVPAEIGVCQFSIEKGVIDKYHRIFPALIPAGYRFMAIQHSESTHNLMETSIKNSSSFEDDLFMFLLKDGGKVPILYVQDEIMDSVDSMIMSFNFQSDLKIYSLDTLLQHMYSATVMEIPKSIAEEFVMSSRFDYVSSLPCRWHQDVSPDAGKHCALSCSLRWVYNALHCLNIQKTFGIKPLKNKHFPDIPPIEGVCEVFRGMELQKNNPMPSPNLSSEPNLVPVHNVPVPNRWGGPQNGLGRDDISSTDVTERPDMWPTLGQSSPKRAVQNSNAKGPSGSLDAMGGVQGRLKIGGFGRGRSKKLEN